MADIFLRIVNMSISACWIVLAVMLLRIILKKAPKWVNCALWGIAGLRLVMPFSFESVFSLVPSAETISKPVDSPRPQIESGFSVIDNQVNDYLQSNYFEGVTRPAGNFADITTILAVVWGIGIVALLIYTLISFLKLRSKIGTAVLLRDNIYQSEAVASPFVLGIIKPKIYLPFNINEQDMEHVIAHEQAHLRRKDHLWKPLGFLILTLHWFNPMVWLGYILLCRDIELACDERVVKELNNEQRADYSQALLTCSVNRRMIGACPVAFGEVGVKDRVKSVLNYKKPAFWVVVTAIVIGIVVSFCFLTNPVSHRLANIEDCELDAFLNEQTAVLTSDGENHLYIGAVEEEKMRNLFDIRISDKEVSLSRDENRDKTNTLIINTVTDEQETLTSYIGGIYVHFNDDFSNVWVNDGVKPTFSYRVKEPGKAKAIYENIVHPERTESIDEAVAKAILDDNQKKYYDFGTECATEGHIIYGTDVDDNIYTVYVLTEYNHFGFMNGYFVSQGGGRVPAVMSFEKTAEGYKLLDIKYAEDGSRHVPSIKEMFPWQYQYRVMNPSEKDYENLWNQNVAYAQAYLNKIGRTEGIRNYSQVEHTNLTDVGVSVEVSNKILEHNLRYNYDLGYFENVEDGVRYVYRKTYDKEQNMVVCTKEVYDTKEVVERIEIDSLTGEIIKIQARVDKAYPNQP